jgi:acyl-coenzyme A synthetase/AMP-(fatty) acid ligase/acyl carrier protein
MRANAAAVIVAGEIVERANAVFPPDLPVFDFDTLPDRRKRVHGASDPGEIAQIIFTSGSTGAPKGVYHDHRALLYAALQRTNTVHLDCEDRVAHLYYPAASAGTPNLLMALLNGASLHILPPRSLGLPRLARELRERAITVCHTVVVLFRRIVDALNPGERLESLRILRLGGERLEWSDFDLFRRACSPDAFLIANLASTETSSIFAQWFVEETVRETTLHVPVGQALPDFAVSLVDDTGRPVAAGEVGEFMVASRYVALGYWNQHELPPGNFLVDPSDPGIRIVKTGDVGRLRPDGLFEFIGRKDQQIKLRGHRIEPSEIEAALRSCEGVRDAAIVVRKNKQDRPQSLIAYVELRPGTSGLLPRHLQAMLSQRLPRHMVPAQIFLLTGLPYLANFKIDRLRLAAIDQARTSEDAPQPGGPIINEVLRVFEAALGSSGATADDNLSSLGGDSLQAVTIALELERRFPVHIPPATFDASRTIREWAEWIAAHDAKEKATMGRAIGSAHAS